jgi:hypothetical protein
MNLLYIITPCLFICPTSPYDIIPYYHRMVYSQMISIIPETNSLLWKDYEQYYMGATSGDHRYLMTRLSLQVVFL